MWDRSRSGFAGTINGGVANELKELNFLDHVS